MKCLKYMLLLAAVCFMTGCGGSDAPVDDGNDVQIEETEFNESAFLAEIEHNIQCLDSC